MAITINGNGTVTGLSVGGINDGAIAHADLADSTKPVFTSYALLEDRKSSGTAGGTATSGDWYTRDLNTEIADPDGIVSLSSNKFTLGAGSYLIKWRCPFYRTEYTQTRLYDVTNSALKQYGWTSYASSADGVENKSIGFARVTISGATAYRIDHACQTTKSSTGLGLASETNASGAYTSGTTEGYSIFTVVEIYKET